MALAPTATDAAEARWQLDELYTSPLDPAIERTLGDAFDFAREFEASYKGRIADLAPAEFAGMMDDLGRHFIGSSQPGLYAHLLHSLDTRDHAAGRLMMRSREAAAERGRHLGVFALD